MGRAAAPNGRPARRGPPARMACYGVRVAHAEHRDADAGSGGRAAYPAPVMNRAGRRAAATWRCCRMQCWHRTFLSSYGGVRLAGSIQPREIDRKAGARPLR